MAVDLARLVVSLEAQTAKYQKELEKANRKLDKFSRNQTRSLKKISAGFRTLQRAAAVAFASIGAGSLLGLVRQTAEAAENLQVLSVRLGINSRELQAWQLIAERSQVSASKFNMGLQRLIRRSGEAAQGMGEAREALKTLGIDAQFFNTLSLDQRLLTLAAAFEEVTDETQQLALGFKLFDSEGTELLQFLKNGREGLIQLRQEYDGQLWTDEQTEKLSKASQRLTEVSQSLRLKLTPALVTAAEWTERFVNAVNRLANIKINVGSDTFFGILQKLFRGEDVQGGGPAEPVELNENGIPISPAAPGIPKKREVNVLEVSRAIANARAFEEKAAQAPTKLVKRKVDTTAIDQVLEYEKEFNESLTAQQRGFADFNDFVLREQQKRVEEQQRLDAQARDSFVSLFADNMVQAAEFGFKSILNSWALTLQQMAAKAAASKIFTLLGGTEGFLGGIFGGGKASGGPVSRGTTYLVGERGPELFTPRTSGTIIPNSGMGQVFNIDARGATPGMEIRIKQAVSEAVALSRQDRIESQRRGRR